MPARPLPMTHVPWRDARILPDSTTRIPGPTADTATVAPFSCHPRSTNSSGLAFVCPIRSTPFDFWRTITDSMRPFVFAFMASLVSADAAFAQQTTPIDYEAVRRSRVVDAIRVNEEEISLDGHLNEAAWKLAPLATDFIQNTPRAGEP